ncbi:hypothetical protein [Litoreibacter albidus]|uniref:Uncharacterized protein n=1 Tax=Litoreibacter albidus TaxID=670155 RepID=A0A1H2W912_9RHOB|nr:hypothetical protein [Litoreibacter albidus]SDW76764.1 hypothetical protein SAMN04488001_1752 [Litoreibacter albidus]
MNTICVFEDCTDHIIFVPTTNINYICGTTDEYSQITLKSGVKLDVSQDVYSVLLRMNG